LLNKLEDAEMARRKEKSKVIHLQQQVRDLNKARRMAETRATKRMLSNSASLQSLKHPKSVLTCDLPEGSKKTQRSRSARQKNKKSKSKRNEQLIRETQ
jgi:hypothetical protein